ncbi:MAG: UDP-3-O-(3-hydroxymyristoyl)glucosamine N-acyltransferase [Desulfobacterales bacterium]
MEKTLEELALWVGGTYRGPGDRPIRRAVPFEDAGPGDVTLAGTPKYLKKIDATNAGVVIVPTGFSETSKDLIFSDNPYAAFARVLQLFYPARRPGEEIHPSVAIGANVRIGSDPAIGPMTTIGNRVVVGDRVTIFGNVFIGDDVEIGDDARIYPNVSILERCRLGDRVTVHAGTVIGSDGFGFAPDGEIYRKIPHTGIVRIDDDVEIGASNAIDRGTFGETRICSGVKTDNLVHIAHNVKIGENTLLVAQVGISGSTTIGRHAVLAGQVGVVGHIHIGDYVMVGAQSGVSKSVPDGAVISGSPEMPHKKWLKVQSILSRLPELRQKLSELERKVDRLGRN